MGVGVGVVAPCELPEEGHEGRAEVREVAVVGVFGDVVTGEDEGEDIGEGEAGCR